MHDECPLVFCLQQKAAPIPENPTMMIALSILLRCQRKSRPATSVKPDENHL